jgi:multidrug efflux pump subunit AcrA (membrane-fusion protein)
MAVSCDDGPEGVVVGEVTLADVVEVVDAPATITATAAATLTAVADGTLAELWVAPGDEVTEGEILAVIDSPEAEQRLEQADEALALADQASVSPPAPANLSATQDATDDAAAEAFDQAREAAKQIADEDLREALLAQVELAQLRYAEASSAAREAVRAVQDGVASLAAAVSAMGAAQPLQARQAYDLAAATVDELTLRAPFGGVVQLGGVAAATQTGVLDDLLGSVGELPEGIPGAPGTQQQSPPGVDPALAPGSLVTAGIPVLTVVDVSELGMRAEVDETDVLLVEPGIDAEVELDAAPGARYRAAVTAVDLLPTPSDRGGVAYGVRLRLAEGSWPDGSAAPTPRPGMSAVAHLRVAEAADTPAVPAAAILRVDGTDVVWAVRDGRAVRTPVTVGVQGPDLVEIVAGLRPGDRIVVSGADQVSEGDRL